MLTNIVVYRDISVYLNFIFSLVALLKYILNFGASELVIYFKFDIIYSFP